jgi:hypothetical protein
MGFLSFKGQFEKIFNYQSFKKRRLKGVLKSEKSVLRCSKMGDLFYKFVDFVNFFDFYRKKC